MQHASGVKRGLTRLCCPGSFGDRSQVAYPTQSASAMQQPASMDLHLSSSEYVSSCSHSEDSVAAVPFAQLLSNAAAGGSDWKVLIPLSSAHSTSVCSILSTYLSYKVYSPS